MGSPPAFTARFDSASTPKWSGRSWPALACALLVAACAERLEPAPLPPDAAPFGPPPLYREWWAQVEACAGRSAAFQRVRWFVVPDGHALVANGQRDDGIWIERYRYIVLAEAWVNDGRLVRHEMLHDLLSRVDHPPEYFRQRCAEIVRP